MRSSSQNITSTTPRAWFHCASLGEYEQAVTVIESYISRKPETPILLTFFSPSGYFPLVNNPPKWMREGDLITALPLDTPRRVRDFLNTTGVHVKFFATCKYEVWPELMKQLDAAKIPSFVFATYFTADAYPLRTNPISKFLFSAWRRFDRIFTQDESSSRLLKLRGIDSVIAGDPRADRVLQIVMESTPPSDLKNWKGDSKVVLAGSSWPEEEGALASLTWDAQIKLLIAPHEVNEANIQRILALFPNSSRYSSGDLHASVVVIDSVGLLSSLYSLADLAVIGGGFGSGLHNVLEPSAFGIPSLSGPKINRFREALSLHDVSALYISSTPSDLSQQVKRLLSSENSQERKSSGLAAKSWVLSQKGAAEKITSYLP
ncbi:MAG TPA: hypothetical protein EYQ21_04000 [Flavobacteriales bacterium]|nr:hypothetical protein [Flavobacteriales bacterium]